MEMGHFEASLNELKIDTHVDFMYTSKLITQSSNVAHDIFDNVAVLNWKLGVENKRLVLKKRI